MSYFDYNDLKKHFSEARIINLAEGDSGAETLATMVSTTSERVDGAMGNAVSIAEALLDPRFTLPISPVPARLVMALCYLTIWSLYESRPELTDAGGKNPFQKHYDLHTEWLQSVGESELGIGGTVTSGEMETCISSSDEREAAGHGTGFIHAGGELDDF